MRRRPGRFTRGSPVGTRLLRLEPLHRRQSARPRYSDARRASWRATAPAAAVVHGPARHGPARPGGLAGRGITAWMGPRSARASRHFRVVETPSAVTPALSCSAAIRAVPSDHPPRPSRSVQDMIPAQDSTNRVAGIHRDIRIGETGGKGDAAVRCDRGHESLLQKSRYRLSLRRSRQRRRNQSGPASCSGEQGLSITQFRQIPSRKKCFCRQPRNQAIDLGPR